MTGSKGKTKGVGVGLRVHVLLLRLLKFGLEFHAKVFGKAFYCSTLTGFNGSEGFDGTLCINSDSSLSCTYVDLDGSATIGDLGTQTMAELLAGSKAQGFRASLAKSVLPSHWCVQCVARQTVNKSEAKFFVNKFPQRLKQIGLENTANCNYACTTCDRSSVYSMRKKANMSLVELEKIAEMTAQYGVEKVIYANLGEPFLSQRLEEELALLRKYNPRVFIETSTNGSVVDSEKKRRAGLGFDRIYFSIHGMSQAQLDKYQKKGDFTKAYANLKEMVAYRNERKLSSPQIYWRYVIFNWNDRQEDIEAAIRLAKEAGVDEIEFSYSIRPFYGISWRYIFARYWKQIDFRSGDGIIGRRIVSFSK